MSLSFSQTPIEILDGGVSQGQATILDFTGASVTATVSGDTATINVTGGGGGGTTGTAVIDFGTTPGTNIITTTVLDASVTTTSVISVFMPSSSTATHNAIEHQIVPIKFTVGNIVNGVSFDIVAVTDWRLDGTFNVNYLMV